MSDPYSHFLVVDAGDHQHNSTSNEIYNCRYDYRSINAYNGTVRKLLPHSTLWCAQSSVLTVVESFIAAWCAGTVPKDTVN